MQKNHYIQIDLLKAFAIISVLLMHIFPIDTLRIIQYFHYNPLYIKIINLLFTFTIYQAIPIFLIIMGHNMGGSFQRQGYKKLSQMYSKTYFKKRFLRLIYPFILVLILAIILGIIFNLKLNWNYLTLMGYLPILGPGNHFISILFQFILIFPLLYYFYQRNSTITLISSFIISILHEILAFVLINNYTGNLIEFQTYSISFIFKYLFAFTLGLWLFENSKIGELTKKSKIILILTAIFSICYLFVSSFFFFNIPFFPPYIMGNQWWGCQTALAFLYPLIIIIIGMNYLPSTLKNKFLNIFAYIGKASYHIFLLQILIFGIGIFSVLYLFKESFYMGISAILIKLTIIICLGLIFFYIEPKTVIILTKLINRFKSIRFLWYEKNNFE